MTKSNFQNETKWCDKCNQYQRYMMSVNHSFCVECGGKVRLFSKADAATFTEDMQRNRYGSTGS